MQSSTSYLLYYNLLLCQELLQLRSKHPHVKLSYTNYYDPIIKIVKSPSRFCKFLALIVAPRLLIGTSQQLGSMVLWQNHR